MRELESYVILGLSGALLLQPFPLPLATLVSGECRGGRAGRPPCKRLSVLFKARVGGAQGREAKAGCDYRSIGFLLEGKQPTLTSGDWLLLGEVSTWHCKVNYCLIT